MKIFAFYLPQFHRIKENDEWWGEGFTEWTNIKGAKPLFKGHNQPLYPLHYNYYNLLDKNTVKWQTELLKKYKIDGLIYYHYYFEGKTILEKPAENLLNDKTIDQNFFFCWANHTWKKSWDGSSKILLEQTYGKKESWERHFQYLLPFFKDKRYEKKNNSPLFMIYLPFFSEKDEMVEYFDKRCKEEGFSGIAIIDSIQNVNDVNYKIYQTFNNRCTQYVFLREPSYGQAAFINKHRFLFLIKRIKVFFRKRMNIGKYVLTFSGDKILSESLKHKPCFSNSLKGLFFEWDNTPRHGYRGYIIKPISKKMFDKFMKEVSCQDYLFINAWNEWCEGMTLEPTEKDGFKYLEWIKEWKEGNDQ